MQLRTGIWFLLSLLLMMGAIFFWRYGDQQRELQRQTAPPSDPMENSAPAAGTNAAAEPFQLLTRLEPVAASSGQSGDPSDPSNSAARSQSASQAAASAPGATNRWPHRLSNTSVPIGQLARSDSAILLGNALIDTALPAALPIPEHLRASEEPGSFLVQSWGPVTPAFRERLGRAGANIVAYIPNNAYLVRVSAAGARLLENAAQVRAVVPYEPYFKLDLNLLEAAVKKEDLPPDSFLQVTLFPGEREAAWEAITRMGVEVVGEERSPFGPQLVVRPGMNSLPALARLAEVQGIEPVYPRQVLSDRQRVIMGVATNSTATANYLDLTGKDVFVNVNDSGVDEEHPDLAGRVFSVDQRYLSDWVGHGTHVLGTILGSGQQSSSVTALIPGSEEEADFKGMAPEASAFVLPIWYWPPVSSPLTDTYLQETAALTNLTVFNRTNTLISNNSWGYVGAHHYNSSSARFDAAVRDALPGRTESQPIAYVFAAGNDGEGDDEGMSGFANSISAPGNAKNVITVGALETFRNLTNFFLVDEEDGTVSTNRPFLGLTDTDIEVASFSSRGNVGIGLEGEFGRFKPDVVAPGAFTIGARSRDWQLEWEMDTNSPLYEIMRELNEPLGPHYRYSSGTSMAAPAVTGVLALMQEFFEQRLSESLRRTNSPAMMKALLINGARATGPLYDFQVESPINFQGWGLVNLTNTLPALLENPDEATWPLRMFDQSATNALATGESLSWTVELSEEAARFPLRVTLVWTDPPGNPSAGIKLVNDLDLVVSNTVTSEVFYGNNIEEGSHFSTGSDPEADAVTDIVNNVENVFIRNPGGSNFVVTVQAKRVNVNAVPDFHRISGRTNDVVQDFALVISSANGVLTNALTITAPTAEPEPALELPPPVSMTNGVPMMNQRVGAHSSLAPGLHGFTNQWSFYVFTNTFVSNEFSSMTNGTNVAFVIFSPPNLSDPRAGEADVDLYVSRDEGLLRLETNVMANAFTSRKRGGNELIVFNDAALDEVFYIGVKAEDQQGAEYGLVGLSTNDPFEEDLDNGSRVIYGYPTQAIIPDGTANRPGVVQIFGIGIRPGLIQRVVVTNTIHHENLGDLLGNLSHESAFAVLNNHTPGFEGLAGTHTFIYDDSGAGDIAGSRPTDGPGSLNDFMGLEASGVWMLNMVDSAPTHTGRVERLVIRVDPLNLAGDLGAFGSEGVSGTVGPNQFVHYWLDVPPSATNLIVRLSQLSGPLEVYLRREAIPSTNMFDLFQPVEPPGGDVTLGIFDEPEPLLAGRYFVSLYNPGAEGVDYHLRSLFEFDVALRSAAHLLLTNSVPLLDNAITESFFDVLDDQQVAEVTVGVRIDHPRVSDLALRLISPQGSRVLLAENRGGESTEGFGSGFETNLVHATFTENTNIVTTPIKFASPPFSGLYTSNNIVLSNFDAVSAGTRPEGEIVDGWRVLTNTVTVVPSGIADSPPNLLHLNNGIIARRLPTVAGRSYTVSFVHRASVAGNISGLVLINGVLHHRIAPTQAEWRQANVSFTAEENGTDLEIRWFTQRGLMLDSFVLHEITDRVFYLPEESLGILRGQRAAGEWKLEIADTRLGPNNANSVPPALLSWDLQIKYAAVRFPGIHLTNGVPYTGVLTNNQTNYFIVDVCETATEAAVLLSGDWDTVTLMADRSGFPTGRETDDFLPFPNWLQFGDRGFAFLLLSTNEPLPAPLQPGRRLYLAVHNSFPNETNNYTMQVFFDRDECEGERPLIRLVHDVPYTNAIVPSPNLFDYYVYNVSSNAARVEFELIPENGDLGLVARRSLPLPTFTNWDYRSDEPGITNELIVINTNSFPEPLAPGDWYLGVYNNSTNFVPYTIRATEYLTTRSDVNVILLTNRVPVDFTIGLGSAPTNYFMFRIMNQEPVVHFELSNLTGEADFLIAYNAFPTTANNFTNLVLTPDQTGRVSIETNSVLPDLRGNWFLAVESRHTNDLDFTIVAELEPSLGEIEIQPSITITNNQLCLSWPARIGFTYNVDARTNVVGESWTNISGPLVANDTVLSYCLPLDTPWRFFRVMQHGAGIDPNANIIPLTNRIPVNFTIGLGAAPTNYFLFSVTNSASVVNFDVSNLTGEGDFILARGELPTMENALTNLAVSATQPGGITLRTNSLLTDLRGDWYLAVLSRHTNDLSFTVVAETEPVGSVEITPEVAFGPEGLCFTWASEIGATYQVDGRLQIVGGSWTNISGTITATNSTTQFCVDQDTPYQFFRVIQHGTGGGGVDPGLNIVPLTNAVPVTFTIGLGAAPTNYFLFSVTNSASMVDFDVSSLNGEADFLVLRGSPDTANSYTNLAVSSILPGQVKLQTNTVLNSLDGDWYLAVQSRHTNNLTFTIRAAWPAPTGTVEVQPDFGVTSEGLCFSWKSQPGRTYIIYGREDIVIGSWDVIHTITATENSTQHCVDLNTSYQFFRVVQEGVLEPTAPSEARLLQPAVIAGNQFSLTLTNTVAGQSYRFETTSVLVPPQWVAWTNVVADANSITVTDPTPLGNNSSRFYRVLLP
jgi:subtilisin-like proprotein convertase family protein